MNYAPAVVALSMLLPTVNLPASPAVASGGDAASSCRGRACGGVGGGGAYVGLTEQQTASLPPKGKTTVTEGGKKVTKDVPFEYVTVVSCQGNTPDNPIDLSCTEAFTVCAALTPPADGPYVRIYRRLPKPEGEAPQVWQYVGNSCWPKRVPNVKGTPQLTLGMIKAQWERTPFAKPVVSVQPVGGRTLVTLPTFFQAKYPEAGFEPGEVNTVTLLGHRVRIKPVFKSNTFNYGDGSGSGETSSAGGVYPDGDITHAYDTPGTFRVGVTTTYGGEYSVDGSAWAPIPGTITVAGPTWELQVVTTKNELVNQ